MQPHRKKLHSFYMQTRKTLHAIIKYVYNIIVYFQLSVHLVLYEGLILAIRDLYHHFFGGEGGNIYKSINK